MTSGSPSFLFVEEDILASVVDTIIPAGDSIGALSVGVDKFLIKLLADCYEKDVQDNVKNQLNNLNTSAEAAYKKSFATCDQAQRDDVDEERSDPP